MIYTVTFNPALDYIMRASDFKAGRVNRAYAAKVLCGGKGINVSWVLKNLGIKSTALGFLAGFTGHEIERLLKEHGCRTDFNWLAEGMSRINVKMIAGKESEVNAPGPKIGDIEPLLEKLDALKEEDVLVLAGSLPEGVDIDTYEIILARTGAGKCVVDTTGEALRRTLKHHPFLIKPNNHELEELFSKPLLQKGDMIECARTLRQEGAQNVLVSLGAEGAILVGSDEKVYECAAPKGTVRGTTGAGDSTVAGFLAGYLQGGNLGYALRMGIAAGSASAFSENLAEKEEIYRLIEQIG